LHFLSVNCHNTASDSNIFTGKAAKTTQVDEQKKHLTIKTKKKKIQINIKNNTSEATGQQVENNFTVSFFFFCLFIGDN